VADENVGVHVPSHPLYVSTHVLNDMVHSVFQTVFAVFISISGDARKPI
jgi:hypothetical protein